MLCLYWYNRNLQNLLSWLVNRQLKSAIMLKHLSLSCRTGCKLSILVLVSTLLINEISATFQFWGHKFWLANVEFSESSLKLRLLWKLLCFRHSFTCRVKLGHKNRLVVQNFWVANSWLWLELLWLLGRLPSSPLWTYEFEWSYLREWLSIRDEVNDLSINRQECCFQAG